MLRTLSLLLFLFSLHNTANGASLAELQNSAKAGDINAMHNIGYIFVSGQDVPQNYPEAMKWFEKAALQGQFNSMYSLGIMYRFGQGTSIDLSKAWAWHSLAAEFIPKDVDEWFIPKSKIEMYKRRPTEIEPELNKDDMKKAENLRAELYKTIKNNLTHPSRGTGER
jgi:hypothetical protein